MINEEFSLEQDCPATLIPAGDEVTLEKGTLVFVTQALGGSITVRTDMGLFRIGAQHTAALGESAQTAFTPEETQQTTPEGPLEETHIWEALKGCYDPEIPINIVDLGLIYDLTITENGDQAYTVGVKMTLTAQGCGMGPTIAADAKAKVEALPQVTEATVDIVWDPPWTPHMISEEGQKTLGLE
tara:strand:+ start:7234 stop:7788 length:555 start_codon:yes stop_codon:yes gene_type:complete